MYRFFEDKSSLCGNKIALSKENSHHITNVLRMRDDEDFEIVIDGMVHLVNICQRDKNFIQALVKDVKEDRNESEVKIHLYQGLPKFDKLELIIQKCIELGVSELTPFMSSRTVVKWDEKKEEKKQRRFEEIAHAAAKQAKRGLVPKINPVVYFEDLKDNIADEYSIIAYEEDGRSLRSVLEEFTGDEINIIVGPEGGFSLEEVEEICQVGAIKVNLGNRILRTETAAIALTAMVQYEIGDINEEV